ncbi:hypothetical protein [Halocatena marina]|uniref:Uncharacterized protein n=1 Tax=Halocatena marina TaxID=2934937 RepID=A0ABD5YJ26_9EURY|nr:hypothetical protein [Halocatena marina]
MPRTPPQTTTEGDNKNIKRVYDRWSHHPRGFDPLYDVVFLGREGAFRPGGRVFPTARHGESVRRQSRIPRAQYVGSMCVGSRGIETEQFVARWW